MSAPTLTPQLAAPNEAAEAVDRHLGPVLRGRDLSMFGWKRPDRQTLLVPIRGYREPTDASSYGFSAYDDQATGWHGLPDGDDYLLKLYFSHYPQSPPSARFVNPETGRFDAATDMKWLPDIQNTNEVFVHANFSGEQLICCSATLEFYLVNHGVEPRHQWDSDRSFVVLLNTLSRHLRPDYYRGRQGS